MHIDQKRELARAILNVYRIREDSFRAELRQNVMTRGSYEKSYEQAAEEAEVDSDLTPLVIAMLVAGYADIPEWANKMLMELPADLEEQVRDGLFTQLEAIALAAKQLAPA